MGKIDKTVDIFIGGKDRKMRFDINSILELEARIPEKNIIILNTNSVTLLKKIMNQNIT